MDKRFKFTVDHMVGRQEIELVVTYSVTPFVAATYWQPAEGGEVEIISVKHKGATFHLSDEEEDAILQQAIERSRDDWGNELAEEAEWREQDRRDRLLVGD